MAKVVPKDTAFSNLFVEVEIEDNVEIIDIWDAYEVIAKYKGPTEYYTEYIVKENERIDQIATKLYGNPDLWWFLLVFNSIVNPYYPFQTETDGTKKVIKVVKPQYLPEILYAIREAKLKKTST